MAAAPPSFRTGGSESRVIQMQALESLPCSREGSCWRRLLQMSRSSGKRPCSSYSMSYDEEIPCRVHAPDECRSLASLIRGVLSPARAQAMSARGRSEIDPRGGQPYSAAALSLVFHSGHPQVPTLRGDVRLFQASLSASTLDLGTVI